MHAVRDVADRDVLHRPVGPEWVPHLARDLLVQRRDGVGVRRDPQRERREPEHRVALVRAPDREELVPLEPHRCDGPGEVALHERRLEDLVPGRDGRVRGEDRRGAHMLQCVVARRPRGGQLAQPLEREQGRVPFVQVEDGRRDAQATQRADAADPEDNLLADPVLAVAAVEPIRDAARRRAVFLQVRVEEVQARPADVGAPDPHGDRLARELEVDEQRAAACLALERQREPRRVVERVPLALPARLVERLPEVTALVEEPDSDERHAELRRGLEVVAREDAKTAGVDRNGLVQRELHREVRDQKALVASVLVPPGRGLELRLERALGGADPRDERRVLGGALEPVVGEAREQDDRVMVGLVPVGRVEVAEEIANRGQPREREVPREPLEHPAELVAAHGHIVVRLAHAGNQPETGD